MNFLGVSLQRERAFREDVNKTFERRVTDLSKQIDRLAKNIEDATNKKVLVIIDDLDKLDLSVVTSIFQDNIKALFSPTKIGVIFTIPISVIREPRLLVTLESESDSVEMLAVTKFFTKDTAHQSETTPIQSNVKILQEALEKRISDDLIEPSIKRKIVLLSGGLMRELMRLGQQCCRECMLELELNPDIQNLKINEAILSEAVKRLRNQFGRSLGSNHYDLLVETYNAFAPPDPRSNDFLELLHGLHVLEYVNGDFWYDLHPLVTDFLRRQGRI